MRDKCYKRWKRQVFIEKSVHHNSEERVNPDLYSEHWRVWDNKRNQQYMHRLMCEQKASGVAWLGWYQMRDLTHSRGLTRWPVRRSAPDSEHYYFLTSVSRVRRQLPRLISINSWTVPLMKWSMTEVTLLGMTFLKKWTESWAVTCEQLFLGSGWASWR